MGLLPLRSTFPLHHNYSQSILLYRLSLCSNILRRSPLPLLAFKTSSVLFQFLSPLFYSILFFQENVFPQLQNRCFSHQYVLEADSQKLLEQRSPSYNMLVFLLRDIDCEMTKGGTENLCGLANSPSYSLQRTIHSHPRGSNQSCDDVANERLLLWMKWSRKRTPSRPLPAKGFLWNIYTANIYAWDLNTLVLEYSQAPTARLPQNQTVCRWMP